jgi:DNA mismatch repair protein MutS2
MSRTAEDILEFDKLRELTARRKMQDVRGEAREELNAAVVQTISESQQDLGVTAAVEAISADRLLPGARIRVRGFSKPVVLRRAEGLLAEIEAGPLRMKIAIDEIIGIEGLQKQEAQGKRQHITVTAQAGEGSATDEINVIGLTVEEASERVDKFLDDATLAHRARVRIIHGHGTGALRRGLAEFLKGHPLVERSGFETEEHGGKAVTVVELRS